MSKGDHTSYESEGIRIEMYADDDAECHSCGKVGKPRRLIHFGQSFRVF